MYLASRLRRLSGSNCYKGMNVLLKYFLATVAVSSIFVYGVIVGKYQFFPYESLRTAERIVTSGGIGRYDNYGRLIDFLWKTETPCPLPDSRTGVLLFIGQSNSANHAESMVKTKYPNQVFNYFSGKCYVAQSPLLGASGQNGEYATLVGDGLIEKNVYDNVLIISSGIGGTAITRWAEGGDLNKMLLSVISDLDKNISITDVVWHQGESDIFAYTHTQTYIDMFLSLMSTLTQYGVDAPYFISVASFCLNSNIAYTYPNNVSEAQTKLIQDYDNIFLGVNTDELVPIEYRPDGCHLGEKGQQIAAANIVRAIADVQKEKP
jgi:hypothetical protein